MPSSDFPQYPGSHYYPPSSHSNAYGSNHGPSPVSGHTSPYVSQHAAAHPSPYSAPSQHQQLPSALAGLPSARPSRSHTLGYYASCGPCQPSPSPSPQGGYLDLPPIHPNAFSSSASLQPPAIAPMGHSRPLHPAAMATLPPDLSHQMCWDAVAHYGRRTNQIPAGSVNNAQTDLVSPHDQRINGPDQMALLPAGHSIGFYDGNRLAHVMVSTGLGRASGNKNDCIGAQGALPVGWQNLDLVHGVQWHNGQIIAPPNNRPLTVVHRPLSQAGQPAQPAPVAYHPYSPYFGF
jgi:hypothetical protein